MCDEARVNQSSIRYSNTVKDIVLSVENGKTFADKFEHLCLDFINEKSKCDEYLEMTKKDIQRNLKYIAILKTKIENLEECLYNLNDIKSSIDAIKKL